MPINNYSVGRDLTLTLVGANGIVSFPGLTSFKSKQDITEEKIIKIDGVTQHVHFFNGWSGSFMLDRRTSAVDDYFATLEADYYAGIQEMAVSLTETIQEANGVVTQYRYTNMLLKLDDAGDWKGDSVVKQSISFLAARRLKIA